MLLKRHFVVFTVFPSVQFFAADAPQCLKPSMWENYITAAYGCAVIHVLAVRVCQWQGLSHIKAAYQTFRPTSPAMVKDEEDEVLHRVHEKRQQTLKATATLWSLAVEIFMSGLFLAQLCCQSAGIPQFLGACFRGVQASLIN